MPLTIPASLFDPAAAVGTDGAMLVAHGPGLIPEFETRVRWDRGTATLGVTGDLVVTGADSASRLTPATLDFGVQAGTLAAPAPQMLLKHQPRDPQFGPWLIFSTGAFFDGVWDPVLHFGYNPLFAAGRNPNEPSLTINFEANYLEAATGKYTAECYSEFTSVGQTILVRPWMFTLDRATGSNRFGINIGPANPFGNFRITSQDTILFQIAGGGISPAALDTVAKFSWSSLETLVYTANSLGSTLALTGVTSTLHLNNAIGIVKWQDKWQQYISGGDGNLYLHDLPNNRLQVVYDGASTSAAALTTFHSRLLANAQVSVINGAPGDFAGRARAIGIGPSSQPLNNYTHYISYSASGFGIANTLNFDLCDGTAAGHVTPLSLRGDNTALFPGTVISTGGFSGPGTALTGITQSQISGLVAALALKAPLASPTLTGTVTIDGTLPFTFTGTSSTTSGRRIATLTPSWANPTDATRAGRLAISVSDWTGVDKEAIRLESDGTQAVVALKGPTQIEGAATIVGALFAQSSIVNGAGNPILSHTATTRTLWAGTAGIAIVKNDGSGTIANFLGTGLTLTGPLTLGSSADADIPNGGIAWSTATPGALKCRTPAGVLKTITFDP